MTVYLVKTYFGGPDHDLEGIYSSRELAEDARRAIEEEGKTCGTVHITEIELNTRLIDR